MTEEPTKWLTDVQCIALRAKIENKLNDCCAKCKYWGQQYREEPYMEHGRIQYDAPCTRFPPSFVIDEWFTFPFTPYYTVCGEYVHDNKWWDNVVEKRLKND